MTRRDWNTPTNAQLEEWANQQLEIARLERDLRARGGHPLRACEYRYPSQQIIALRAVVALDF